MSLEMKDSLQISTPLGNSHIQLLLGDITKLPVEEKVDFIFTSAFIGNYSAAGGTLIGSLKRNLNIRVDKLAKNKEIDLRVQFSCWMSAPLDDELPYKRLVCFEQTGHDSVDKQLSRLFRAMMPIFNNQDTTVITPVLATGNQGRPIDKILPAMVKAAREWIKAGLPLRCLKIVLYSNTPTEPTDNDKACLEIFASLKAKWMKKEKKKDEKAKTHDICLSFNKDDKELAQVIVRNLLAYDQNLSIHSQTFVFKEDVLWQEHVYLVMANSKRVIPLLTPAYIHDMECLEQFNMALCCNRLKMSDSVIPFYMKTCDSLPSYMSLVQYMDCRSIQSDNNVTGLIKAAAQHVVESLSHTDTLNERPIASEDSQSVTTKNVSPPENRKTIPQNDNEGTKQYDIFISYSHQHKEDATRLVEILESQNPDLEVFFDRDDLKAGNLWQRALYDAVEQSHCMVAFLTPGYLSSSVCNEEFNIATARYFAKDAFLLLPIHTGIIDRVPKCFSYLPCVDLCNEGHGLETLAGKMQDMLPRIKEITKNPNMNQLKTKMEELRARQFRERFCLEGRNITRNTAAAQDFNISGSVMFLFAQDCLKFAAIMSVILKKLAPGLVIHLQPFSQTDRTKLLEAANMVVVFLSNQLASSQSLLDELHTVLCRQRVVKDSTIVYLIESDHTSSHTFHLHSLPVSVSVDDNMWKRLEHASGNRNPRPFIVDAVGMQGTYRCKAFQNLALTAASHDVVYLLSLRGSGSSVPYNIVNMAQVEDESKGIAVDFVPVNENIISLTAVELMLSKKMSSHKKRKSITPANASNEVEAKQMTTLATDSSSMPVTILPTTPPSSVISGFDELDLNSQGYDKSFHQTDQGQKIDKSILDTTSNTNTLSACSKDEKEEGIVKLHEWDKSTYDILTDRLDNSHIDDRPASTNCWEKGEDEWSFQAQNRQQGDQRVSKLCVLF